MTIPDSSQLPDTLAAIPSGGSSTAVVEFLEDEARRTSFDELIARADRLAAGIREETQPEETVVLFAPPSTQAVLAVLGVLRSGRVLVPLDTQMPDEDLKGVLKNCGASIALSTGKLARRLNELDSSDAPRPYLIDGAGDTETGWDELMGKPSNHPDPVDPESVAVLFYTSGTTGPPKGVPLTHRNLLFQLKALADSKLIRSEDRVLLPLPLHHVYPLVIGLFAPLAFGLPVILPAGLTGPALLEALREGKASLIIGVPRLYKAFHRGISQRLRESLPGRLYLKTGLVLGKRSFTAAKLWFKPLRRRTAPFLRLLASGGSPLGRGLARDLEGLGWPVAVGYGLTETSPLLTLKKPGEGDYETVGTAIEGVELRTDPKALSPEDKQGADGREEHGELLAKGPNIFSGYHRNKKATDKAFTEEGWFRTGDVGRIDDEGFLYLKGRVSTRIALQGGQNVDPEALEDRYGKAEPVEEIGILEHDGQLAALVRPTDELLRDKNAEEAGRAVRDALEKIGADLASYQRISRVEICSRPLPRTRLGKLRRHELAEKFSAAGEKAEEADEEPASAPVPVEDLPSNDRALLEDERVRALWDLLCERYADQPVAPEAHLQLDLGIDSMEWVELSMAIEEKTGLVLGEDRFSQADRVRDLLEIMASAEEAGEEGTARILDEPEDHLREEDLKWTRPRGRLRHALSLLFYFPMQILFRLWFNVRVEGESKLPDEPFILAPNHGSYLDAPALAAALGMRLSSHCFWAGYTGTMFANPLARLISRWAQVVPVDPRRGPVSSLATAATVLDRGSPLVWFPEGERSQDGSLQSFKRGIGLLLKHRDEKLVPVRIMGAHEAWPPGRKWPGRHAIRIWIGDPIETEALRKDADGDDPGSIAKALREAYVERTKGASAS